MARSNPSDLARIEAREALVVGRSPRIAPLDPAQVGEAALASSAQLKRAASGSSAPLAAADLPEIVLTLLRHPDLFKAITDLSIQLLAQGALAPRDREILALRTCWLCETPFEWGEHVQIAKAVGLSSEEIERITQGSTAEGWNDHEQALLRAAEELREGAMISDATWDALARGLDERQLFELTIVVGHFTNVSYFENSLRLRLSRTNPGLLAR